MLVWTIVVVVVIVIAVIVVIERRHRWRLVPVVPLPTAPRNDRVFSTIFSLRPPPQFSRGDWDLRVSISVTEFNIDNI